MNLRAAAAAILLASLASPASSNGQPADPYQPWARVLAKYVDAQGRVYFRGVAADRADLDSFLGYVARTSPRSSPASFPDNTARIAYYLNAYNALAMHNVIDSGFPRALGALQRVKFFGLKRFTIDVALHA